MSLIIKICGLTRPDEAVACAELGADAIGINLWPRSPRHVSLDQARAIRAALRGRRTLVVGVFVNAAEAEVAAALDQGLIDAAQLHGDEPPEALAQVAPARLWKALRLGRPEELARIAAYPAARFSRLVIDAPSPGYGGSGLRLDTGLARAAAEKREVLLAGGLSPENVGAAIRAVAPAGVDVASGVESRPGRKDLGLVAAFIAAVRAAEPTRSHP